MIRKDSIQIADPEMREHLDIDGDGKSTEIQYTPKNAFCQWFTVV